MTFIVAIYCQFRIKPHLGTSLKMKSLSQFGILAKLCSFILRNCMRIYQQLFNLCIFIFFLLQLESHMGFQFPHSIVFLPIFLLLSMTSSHFLFNIWGNPTPPSLITLSLYEHVICFLFVESMQPRFHAGSSD